MAILVQAGVQIWAVSEVVACFISLVIASPEAVRLLPLEAEEEEVAGTVAGWRAKEARKVRPSARRLVEV